MNPVLVVLAALLAVGLGYVTADSASTQPRNRLRGEWRSASLNGETSVDVDGADVASVDGDPESGDVTDPETADPETPVEPETPDIVIEIDDELETGWPLVTVDKAEKLDTLLINRIHVGYDNERSWHGGDKAETIESNGHLKKMALQRNDRPFVVVGNKDTLWFSVRDLIQQLERSAYVQDIRLGVQTADEPKVLKLLRFPQSGSASLPLPEGADVFRVGVEGEEGEDPVYSVNGKTLETFPMDLAMAWNDHKSKFSTVEASVTNHDDSKVVLDGDRDALYRHVVAAIEVLRNLGIEAIRIDHGTAMRRVR